jgi:hypothetical protein
MNSPPTPPKRSAPGREIAGAAKLRLPQVNSNVAIAQARGLELLWAIARELIGIRKRLDAIAPAPQPSAAKPKLK